MIVSKYYTFEGKSFVESATYDEVLYKLKRANDEVYELTNKLEKVEAENDSLQESHIKLYNDTKDTIRSLKEENQELKQKIQYERDRYDRDVPFFKSTLRRDDTITKLQDQHQQDCIRYNDMRTAYLVTIDELARLREQLGIGR